MVRYERIGDLRLAMLDLACADICVRRPPHDDGARSPGLARRTPGLMLRHTHIAELRVGTGQVCILRERGAVPWPIRAGSCGSPRLCRLAGALGYYRATLG